MANVFVSGSMQIKKLDSKLKARIEKVIDSGFDVVIGDADGVDTAIQRHLNERGIRNVTVFCSGEKPRNNIGNWNVERVESKHRSGSREFFTAKDIEMARIADYGFMVWDSMSTGTLNNIVELLTRKKKSLVYINRAKEFVTISAATDINRKNPRGFRAFFGKGGRADARGSLV